MRHKTPTPARPMYRQEIKCLISIPEYHILRRQLARVLPGDPNTGEDHTYIIRSLYFDDIHDTGFFEKATGVGQRKKLRLRTYNYSDERINLEKKVRSGTRVRKETTTLTPAILANILKGRRPLHDYSDDKLLTELYVEQTTRLSRPVLMLDYKREAYTHPSMYVRVCFDSCLKLCIGSTDLFDPQVKRVSIFPDSFMLLEIKYAAFLPDHIASIIGKTQKHQVAFSKYAQARQMGYYQYNRTQYVRMEDR